MLLFTAIITGVEREESYLGCIEGFDSKENDARRALENTAV
jgi:hypothetical protein